MDGLPNCETKKSSDLRDLAEFTSDKSLLKKPRKDFFSILLDTPEELLRGVHLMRGPDAA